MAVEAEQKPDLVIRLDVIGNGRPITNSGYDFIRLLCDHLAVFPDGTTQQIPAGTLLYRGVQEDPRGYEQNCGVAAASDKKDPRDGDA